MNNICWECAEPLENFAVFEWEVPCECGALNFVKVHAGCYFTIVKDIPLLCRLCDKPLEMTVVNRKLTIIERASKDEEDIT